MVVIILTLSLIDLTLTYYYINKYKKWQPDKPYKMMERNPLLVFLWNKLGLNLGMFVGAVIILTLNYIICSEAHPIIIGILLLALCFVLFNHFKNIDLLINLIRKYPIGHLPEEVFGKVIGNNQLN